AGRLGTKESDGTRRSCHPERRRREGSALSVASAPRHRPVRITYIGGPTALLEFAGARFLTDPTFDPGGTAYPTPHYTLHKTAGPAYWRRARRRTSPSCSPLAAR